MKDKILKAASFLSKNKKQIVVAARDEAVTLATETAKSFVWKYLVFGGIISFILGFISGSFVMYFYL